MGSRQGVLVVILVFATFFLWNLYNIMQLGNISTCEDPSNNLSKDLTKCEKQNELLRTNLSSVQRQLQNAISKQGQKDPNKGSTISSNNGKQSEYDLARAGSQNNIIPVIIFAYNRPEYLTRSLDTLIK